MEATGEPSQVDVSGFVGLLSGRVPSGDGPSVSPARGPCRAPGGEHAAARPGGPGPELFQAFAKLMASLVHRAQPYPSGQVVEPATVRPPHRPPRGRSCRPARPDRTRV